MFYRIQGKGIELEQMQRHNSACGCDDRLNEHPGLCACEDADDLHRYIRSFACDPSGKLLEGMDDDFEIVVFEGRRVGNVYDGVLTYPERIIERLTVSAFMSRLQEV